MTDGPLVLGIETSCDETGVGIVRGRELLADEVASSMDQHARFGGVVPEVASRAHLEAMVPVLEGAFAKAGVRPSDIDAVAVALDLLVKNQGQIASGVLQQLLARNNGLGAKLQTLHQVNERTASHLRGGCAKSEAPRLPSPARNVSRKYQRLR